MAAAIMGVRVLREIQNMAVISIDVWTRFYVKDDVIVGRMSDA